MKNEMLETLKYISETNEELLESIVDMKALESITYDIQQKRKFLDMLKNTTMRFKMYQLEADYLKITNLPEFIVQNMLKDKLIKPEDENILYDILNKFDIRFTLEELTPKSFLEDGSLRAFYWVDFIDTSNSSGHRTYTLPWETFFYFEARNIKIFINNSQDLAIILCRQAYEAFRNCVFSHNGITKQYICKLMLDELRKIKSAS